MKKIIYIVLLGVSLTSCSVTYPGVATGNKAEKQGIAERKVWLGIALKPVDVSIEKAAKNGKISKIATVDHQVIGGLFSTTYKTIVTGN
jgi:cytochrome c biogenesis protein ResB